MNKLDFLIVGVGGQGNILASDILGETALAAGYDVKKADVLGMAQRGGAVVSHIRLGQHVYSPLVNKGNADFLVAFEKLEAARWAGYLRQGGVAIVNNHALPPLSVTSGTEPYPSDDTILAILRDRTNAIWWIDALPIAAELGESRAFNIVILGFLSSFLPLEVADWEQCLSQRVPPRFLELNLRAFFRGREEAQRIKEER